MNKNYTYEDHPYNDVENIASTVNSGSKGALFVNGEIIDGGYNIRLSETMGAIKDAIISGRTVIINEPIYNNADILEDNDHYLFSVYYIYVSKEGNHGYYNNAVYTSNNSYYAETLDDYPKTYYNTGD